MSFLIDHFNMFWYIDIPTILAVLFYIGQLIYRAILMRDLKRDEAYALETVALYLGYSRGQAKGLRVVRYLLDDNKDDGFAILLENGDLVKIPRVSDELNPIWSASRAIDAYLKKYGRADVINRVAIFILGSCLLAYTVSWIFYCMFIA